MATTTETVTQLAVVAAAEQGQYDLEQLRLMEEVCIVVDDEDRPLRAGSKRECHLATNIEHGLLHRAFSLFVFDPVTRKLLLQQRSREKITFPEMWTNTCCSHPLHVAGELGVWTDGTSVQGAKKAARRKVLHELGIRLAPEVEDEIRFITRIHYAAPSDGLWGEHEIDYILFLVASVEVNANPNEVMDTRWVDPSELRAILQNSDVKKTPWFQLICDSYLYNWWEELFGLSDCKHTVAPDLVDKIVRM